MKEMRVFRYRKLRSNNSIAIVIAITVILALLMHSWHYIRCHLLKVNQRCTANVLHRESISSSSLGQHHQSIVDVKETTTIFVEKITDDNSGTDSVSFIKYQDDYLTSSIPYKIETIANMYISNYSTNVRIASCQDPALITLVINSAAGNFDRRQAIRRTWGNSKEFELRLKRKNVWKTVFVIGRTGKANIDKSVDEEAKKYGDLIVAQIQESHRSLTDKTVLGMYWSRQACKTKFYYKGDDDVWINKWLLFDYMMKLSTDSSFDSGNCWIGFVSPINHVPIRKKHSKYYVSYRDFPGSRFPPFCSGFGYFMAGDTVDKIIVAIPDVKKIQGIDDVYVGLLANNSGVRPTSDRRFHIYTYDASKRKYTVDGLFDTIAEHGVLTSKLMIKFHKLVRDKYIEVMKIS